MPQCLYVTAASPLIADSYAETYGIKRPHVILNTFPLAQAPAGHTPKGGAEPGPSIYWFSQTIGGNRGIECAIRAIGRAASQPHLYLRGALAEGFRNKAIEIAAAGGTAGHVHFLDPAPPVEMERLASHYDLGLASETGESISRQVCLTNKLFSFLLAGVPPLMSATTAQMAFAKEAGLDDLIYPIDDDVALASIIDQLLLNPVHLAGARARMAPWARAI